jgi:hypothetical protein
MNTQEQSHVLTPIDVVIRPRRRQRDNEFALLRALERRVHIRVFFDRVVHRLDVVGARRHRHVTQQRLEEGEIMKKERKREYLVAKTRQVMIDRSER